MEVKTVDRKLSKEIAGTLAKNLRRLMEEKSFNAYRISEKCGVPAPSIYRFLDPKNSSDPTASTIMRLCDALDCEPNDLLSP